MKTLKTQLVLALLLLCSITFTGLDAQTKKGNTTKSNSRNSWSNSSSIYFAPDNTVKPHLPKWPKKLVSIYDTTSILFIGDVMQHGNQLKSALKEGCDPNDANSYEYSYAFKYIKEDVAAADIAVANMEFPLGIPPYSGYPVFSAPHTIAVEAANSGFDLFMLANNHIMDKGAKGFERTLAVYDSLQLAYIGAHKNSQDEQMNNPKIIETNGLKIAFINFTYGTNGIPVPKPFVVNMMDSTAVKQAIARGKERGADMIIALPHWGIEYQLYPSGQQKEWASMLFKNGVNVIIGSHPHVPQSAEIYINNTPHPRKYGAVEKMVFYSLGNYISNQSDPDYTQLGMMVKIYIIKNNLSGEITLGMPEYEYLWCFKKNEFDPDYTVVPVNDLMQDPSMMAKIKSPQPRERMENAFKLIMNKKLVREL